MKKPQISQMNIILAIIFIIIGVLTRTIFHFGPNTEFVTALTLASAYYFVNKKFALIVPLAIMFFSDLIIGNTTIYLFTWSGFLITFLIGELASNKRFKKLVNSSFLKKFLFIESIAILSTIIFFLWTNFGVVVLGNMYSHDINGLILSYINGLPFLRPQIIGNIVFTPAVFITVESFIKKKINFKSYFREFNN